MSTPFTYIPKYIVALFRNTAVPVARPPPPHPPPSPQVIFKAEFQAGASGRSFGWVKLDGESLAAAVAGAGWAKVKDQGASSKSSELDELVSFF